MKKLLYILFILSLSVFFVACGGDEEEVEGKSKTITIIIHDENNNPINNALVRVYQGYNFSVGYVYIGNGQFKNIYDAKTFIPNNDNISKSVTNKEGKAEIKINTVDDNIDMSFFSFAIDRDDYYIYLVKGDIDITKTDPITISL